jgi:hypothetical protein
MLTVVWNTEGFHIVHVLPKGATFDSDYYCENSLSEILRACPVHRLVVHADNARPHTSKPTRQFMEKSPRGGPHPPFSVDLALSGLFLFGHIKGKLHMTEFTEKDDFLAEILGILNGKPGNVLKWIFSNRKSGCKPH